MNRAIRLAACSLLPLSSLLAVAAAQDPAQPVPQVPSPEVPAPVVQVPPAEAGPAPEIYSPEPIAELGEVLQGEIRKHSFVIGNRGEGDLVVHRVNPTCGCTVANVKTMAGQVIDVKQHVDGTPLLTLKKGETCEIPIEFNSTGQQAHKLEKTIVVISSDNKQPALQLTLRVDVTKAYVLEPNPLQFGEVSRGQKAAQTAWIKLTQPGEIAVTGFKDVPAHLDVTWEKGTAPDGAAGIAIHVAIKADAPTGFLTNAIVVQTDHPRIKEIPINVYGQVKSEVAFDTGNPISRERLDFEVIPAGEERTREITITNGNPQVPYKLLKVDVESSYKDQIKVETTTVTEGIAYKIKVTTTKDLQARFFRGTLKVAAEHPDLKLKAIDFHGWVKKAG